MLLGWLVGVEYLKSVVPGFVAMNPLTACCFVLGGLSLWLTRISKSSWKSKLVSRGIAILLVLIGAIKLVDYWLGLELGLDRILFAGSLGKNQMAPNTALCFLLAGTSLAALDWVTKRGYWPAHGSAAALAVIAAASLVGYGYGASGMYRMSSFIPMALNTAIGFLVLSLGLLLSRPDRGMAKVIFHSGQGGMMARRLIPIGILVPCALGWLRVMGQRLGWYDMEFGAAAMVAVTTVVLTGAVLGIAKKLNESDDERKLAARKLSRQSEEIRDLYDNAPCGYHSLDPNGVFIAINRTELAWLGYEREELVGKKKFSDVITPAGTERFRDEYQEFIRRGYVKDLEFELVRKDGTTMPVILNSTAISAADGTFVASRTTLFDATERKRIEDAMRSFNAELEKRVAERTELWRLSNTELVEKSQENEMFVYSVSHDLRSPLVNLQGFSQELGNVSQQVRDLVVSAHMPTDVEARTTRLIDEDMQRCIRFIQSAVGRLSGIINALLRLSRAGRVEYEPRVVDLRQTVNRVIESMSSIIYDSGVKVKVQELPSAWGDPTAFEQVFANLIGNAVNYLDSSRPGRIEVGSMPARDAQAGITYYVKDNGLGIPEAYQSKVFQALKRLHPKIAGGEGIGLALVKRIVERHGGEIWFESSENAGSTFYVRLPVLPTRACQAPKIVPPSQQQPSIQHERNSLGNPVS